MNSGRWLSGIVRAACVTFLALHLLEAQTEVNIAPPGTNALPGSTFTLDVAIHNVVNLHLYHVIVHFDNSILRCTGVTNGGFLPGIFFLHSPPNLPSDTARFVTVDDALAGTQTQSGSGTLFSIQFNSLQVGTSPVVLVEVVLRDEMNQSIAHSLVNGLVTVGIPPVVYVDWSYAPGSAGGHDFGFDAFTTVAAGVQAVSNGGVVHVNPGTYREQIHINKNVMLAGSGALGTVIAPPAELMNQPFLPSRQERPIIGVDSMGTSVVIDGFTIDGEGAGNTQPGMVGIQYFKGSGIVRHNTIKRVRATPFDGTQSFIGIMVNHDYPRSFGHAVEICDDSVYDIGKGGIVCNHPGTFGNVHHNVVIGQGPVGAPLAAQNGIQFGFGAEGSISFNTISHFSYTGPSWSASGILGIGSNGTLDIMGNSIFETQTSINLQQTAYLASGGTSANLAGNSIAASTGGTGVPTYYGVVTWSLGGSIADGRHKGAQRPAEAMPLGLDEVRQLPVPGAPSQLPATMAILLHKNSLVSTSPGSGVGVYHLAAEMSPQTVAADSNALSGYSIGVVTDKDLGAVLSTTWYGNRFIGNNYGMYDFTEVLQDARQNWWGSVTGPRDVKSLPAIPNYNNPDGTGDSVGPFVDYRPWYLEAVQYEMQDGWNIVSLPLTVEDRRKTVLFPSSVSSAFGYVPLVGYVVSDTLVNCTGYWLKFSSQQNVPLNGLLRICDTVEVCQGWNLIGTISNPTPCILVRQDPPTIVSSSFFGYSGGYQVADTLKPGKGYWVKANSSGILILSGHDFGATESAPRPSIALEGAGTITVADARGSLQILRFASDDFPTVNPDFFELPPLPPAGVFDARFSTNRMLETVKAGDQREVPIQITDGIFPLTIRWEKNSQLLPASLLIGDQEVPLSSLGSVRVGDSKSRLVLRLGGLRSLPMEFVLHQNFPNPFNPGTTFKYDLPVNTRVLLRVFNMLGQEVATLVDDEQKAGSRSVLWDASNIASGVYFYRLDAGNYTGVKKLLLLR